ncbi:MAG: histidine kinase [Cryomorphaceae bacterium]
MAQEPFFNHYTTEDGLPSIECYDIIQDKAGFIWIGTDRGLARFDGTSIRQFTTKDGLPGNVVTTLYPASDGHVWANCYEKGMVYSDGHSVLAPAWNAQVKKRNTRIDDFLDLGNGEQVVTFFSSIINRTISLLIRDNKVVEDNIETEANAVVWVTESQGEYVFGYRSVKAEFEGKNVLNIKGPGFTNGAVTLPWEIDRMIDATVNPAMNTFYLAMNHHLIAVSDDLEIVGSFELPSAPTNSVMVDNSGDLWVGTMEHGALKFPEGDLNATPEAFLNGLSVTSTYEDKDKGIWMCTIQDGIFHMPFADLNIFTQQSGLPEQRATYALKSNKEIFAIFRDGAILKAPLRNENPTFEQIADYRYVFDAFIGDDDRLNVSVEIGERHEHPSIQEWIPTSYIYNGPGDTMIIALIGQLNLMIIGEDTIVMSHQGELPRTYSITCDRENFYFGTKEGLYSLNKKDHEPVWLGQEEGSLASAISSLATHQEDVYVGSAGQGLTVLSKEGDNVHLSTLNGLASDYINNIVIDDQERIWLCTPSGIDMIDLKTIKSGKPLITYVGVEQGLPVPSVNDLLIYEEHIWAMTDGGIAIIPIPTIINDAPPSIYLSRLEVNGVSAQPADQMRFSTNENNIEFAFEAISFKNQSRQQLHYQLNQDGAENPWRITHARQLSLVNLSPGAYTLIVQSKPGDVPDDARLTFQFEVMSPLWQRWNFILGFLVLFTTGVLVLTQRRVRRIRQRAALEQQISSLSYRALRSQMNPHFIYNALNAIQNFIINQDQTASINYLSNFSKLIRSIFESSSKDHVPLHEELNAIELYVSLESARYPGRFEFIQVIGEDCPGLRIAPMIIQPFVENAILHGVLPNAEKGKITLKVHRNNGFVEVVVEDNGIGINKGREIGIKKRKYLSHLDEGKRQSGMSVTKERIDQLARQQQFEANFRAIDLSTQGEDQHGTRITFNLPYTEST